MYINPVKYIPSWLRFALLQSESLKFNLDSIHFVGHHVYPHNILHQADKQYFLPLKQSSIITFVQYYIFARNFTSIQVHL